MKTLSNLRQEVSEAKKMKGGKQVPNCIPEENELDEISTKGYYTAAAKSRLTNAVKVASSMGTDKQAKTKLDARSAGMKRIEKRTQDDMKKANSGPQKPRVEKEPTEAERRGYGQGRFMGDSYEPQFQSRETNEAKDPREYGYEGDMALNQLKTLVRCAEMIEDMLKPDTDLPEWVQSKITLATDYIQTAADYMYSEMNEENNLIDEAEQTDESRKSFYINSKNRKNPVVALARKQRRNFRKPPMVGGKNVNLENVSEALSARDRLTMAMNREKAKREAHEKASEAREAAKKMTQQTTQPEQKIKEGIASLISKNIKKLTATKLTPQQKADIRLNK